MRKGLMLAAALMMPVGSIVPMQAAGAEVTYAAQGPVVELFISSSVESDADLATVLIGVKATGKTAAEAYQNGGQKAEAVLAAIQPFAAKDGDLEAGSINVNEDYDWSSDKPKLNGFNASINFTLKLRDFDRINDVMNAATKAGATDINGPYFSIENTKPDRDKARQQGLDSLLQRAREHARWAGYDDVKIIWVAEDFESDAAIYATEAAAEAAGDAAAVFDLQPEYKMPIIPGKITTTVRLKATFEMVRK